MLADDGKAATMFSTQVTRREHGRGCDIQIGSARSFWPVIGKSHMDEESPPSVHVRWFQIEVSELLSTVPLVLNSSPTWRPLTREESDACEAAWLKYRIKKKETRRLSSTSKVSTIESEAVDDEAETTRSVSPLPVPPGMTSCSSKYALYVSLKNRMDMREHRTNRRKRRRRLHGCSDRTRETVRGRCADYESRCFGFVDLQSS